MQPENLIKTSKFLSLVLRHQPDKIGLELDEAGWVPVATLLSQCSSHGVNLTLEKLEQIVATSDKKRFAFSDDRQRIRANQGHSVEVSLGYQPQVPPEKLFHGTASRFLESIRKDGLVKGKRHHVHLSADIPTAVAVGKRHGKPLVIEILAAKMHAAGHLFYLSENQVWLADRVPTEFMNFPES
jgi:putative RNA 2'-phosphotransferase